MSESMPLTRDSRTLILEELRRSHAHQMKLFEENDDKSETVMRLGVFAVTGIAVFLTYAGRADAAFPFLSAEARVLILVGALLQAVSFLAVLQAYGVIGKHHTVSVGADLTSRAGTWDRAFEDVEDVISEEYRKAITENGKTYGRISRLLSLASFSLLVAAAGYFGAILITVNP